MKVILLQDVKSQGKKDQIIMEKLGGGGHFDMAGAQIKDTSLTYACELLKGAIDDYLDHDIAERK